MLCGEPLALSVMVMAAVSAPVAAGVKWPWMVQFAPPATLVPQLFENTNEEASAPVTAMLVMARGPVPVLVSVTDCDALVTPTRSPAKIRLLADRDTAGGVRPVPDSEMLCGEPLALSVMVMAAVSAPVVAGVKWPWMAQFAPAATLVPQLFENTNEEASVPVTAMLVMTRGPVPVLVSVTDCDALVTPTRSPAKDKLLADRDTAGGVAPLPLREIDCGELDALSVMVMAAVSAPVVAGVKWPWMVQFAPAATLVPQLFANTNEEASVPVTAMLVMARGPVPVLVSITDCDGLVTPGWTEPKERLVVERVTTAGVRPVPLREIDCGELAALSVMVMAAVSAPVVAGVKWPWMVQFAPAATLVPQLFANTKEEASVPVTAMLAMARGAVPVLVSVTDCDALVDPRRSLP